MQNTQGPWADAGQQLQAMRQQREITEAELAEQAGAPSRQWVLDIEHGRRAVPSSMYSVMASIYGLPVREFATLCLRFYDRKAYDALFGDQTDLVAVAA